VARAARRAGRTSAGGASGRLAGRGLRQDTSGLSRLLQRAGGAPPRADSRGQRSGRRPGPQAPGGYPAGSARPGGLARVRRLGHGGRARAAPDSLARAPPAGHRLGWPRASTRSSWARSTARGTTTSPGSSATARWRWWAIPSGCTTSPRTPQRRHDHPEPPAAREAAPSPAPAGRDRRI
jgi:hypothetical protein